MPTSTNAAANKSATGTGLNATATAFFRHSRFRTSFVADLPASVQDASTDLVAEVGGKKARIQGGKCLPFIFENLPQAKSQLIDVRQSITGRRRLPAIIFDFNNLLRARLCRHRKDIVRLHESRRLFPNRCEQRIKF